MGGPSNLAGFGCCGGSISPTPCPNSINLKDYCTGDPIEGAVITIYSSSAGDVATGATDADGNYTFPDPTPAGIGGFGTNSFWRIEWDGAILFNVPYIGLSVYNCGVTIDYCYVHGKLTVTTPSDATVIIGPVSPWVLDSADSTPGSTVYTYKDIAPCVLAPFLFTPFPQSFCLVAGGDNYIPNCGSVTVDCGVDATLDIPLFDFTADYWGYSSSCDLGCAGTPDFGCANTTYGEGPSHRGVFPRKLFVTLAGNCNQFNGQPVYDPGSLAGTTIELDWNGTFWDSGCLAASTSCCGGPYSGVTATNARVILTASGPPQLTIAFFSDGACTTGTPGCFAHGAIAGFNPCQLTSPVDVVGSTFTLTD